MERILSYRELLAQALELDRKINAAREEEASAALQEVKRLIAEFGFTVGEVFSAPKPKKRHRRSGQTYRNPQTGATWSGLGREPGWIKGKDRSAFIADNDNSI